MKFSRLQYLIYADLYRLYASLSTRKMLRQLLLGETFPYIFWMRVCAWLRSNKTTRHIIYPFVNLYLLHLSRRFGIIIHPTTTIGPGLFIQHFGGVIINSRSIIGKNCNLSSGVVFGYAQRGRNVGAPVVGDNVYIGPGAKIVGAVKIGNNVAIGANCVVTRDIPDNSVVVGIPGAVVSDRGAKEYVERTDYDSAIRKKMKRRFPM